MLQPTSALRLHHIGVQTADLATCLAWYQDFFGCQPTWSTDRFSQLTLKRLPGIIQLAEVTVADLRFHLFERAGCGERRSYANETQFQHVCVAVGSAAELRSWRHRWLHLFRSGRYAYRQPDQPTEVVTDTDGVQSFYCVDVNGLEFEFTYIPGGTS